MWCDFICMKSLQKERKRKAKRRLLVSCAKGNVNEKQLLHCIVSLELWYAEILLKLDQSGDYGTL